MELGDDGAYRPVYDSHWVALDAKIVDNEVVPGEMTDDEKNEYLWGSSFGLGDAGDFLSDKAREERGDRGIDEVTGKIDFSDESEDEDD
jgi:hypothetical protein